MTRLAGTIDGMIGVDLHRDTLAAAVTDMVGGLLAQTSVRADGAGSVSCSRSPRGRCPVGAVGRCDRPAHPAAGRRGGRAAAELERLVAAVAPWLLKLPGVGPISAAQMLVSWSHAGRLRSEAAFAALAGANPIPASSGPVTRHRLNRSGDRQLNRACIPWWWPGSAMTPTPAPTPPTAGRGQEHPRHPAMLEASRCPTAVQAP